jgi:hypothetical protein
MDSVQGTGAWGSLGLVQGSCALGTGQERVEVDSLVTYPVDLVQGTWAVVSTQLNGAFRPSLEFSGREIVVNWRRSDLAWISKAASTFCVPSQFIRPRIVLLTDDHTFCLRKGDPASQIAISLRSVPSIPKTTTRLSPNLLSGHRPAGKEIIFEGSLDCEF